MKLKDIIEDRNLRPVDKYLLIYILRNPGKKQQEIAEHMGYTRQSVGYRLNDLEHENYINIQRVHPSFSVTVNKAKYGNS